MEFRDKSEEHDFDFMLRTVFNHVPAGIRQTGDFKGEPYNEFWWRGTNTEDGYLIVWYDENRFATFHTYRYPEDLY